MSLADFSNSAAEFVALRAVGLLPSVPVHVHARDRATVRIGLESFHLGVRDQLQVLVLGERGAYAADVGVGLPVGQAWEPVEPVAANAAPRLRV
jgi:hypothetical protein